MELCCQHGKNYYWKYCRNAPILLENQLKSCDNINGHFLLYIPKTCPMVLQHRLRRGLFNLLMFIIECMFAFVNREIELMFDFCIFSKFTSQISLTLISIK